MKKLDGHGCCLVGHPGYYREFGFANLPGLTFPGVPPEAFMSLTFHESIPQGEVTFHPAFLADGSSS